MNSKPVDSIIDQLSTHSTTKAKSSDEFISISHDHNYSLYHKLKDLEIRIDFQCLSDYTSNQSDTAASRLSNIDATAERISEELSVTNTTNTETAPLYIPQTSNPPPLKKLVTEDTNMTFHRLQNIVRIRDPHELEKSISMTYNCDEIEDESDAEIISNITPNVYRDDGDIKWDIKQMEDLHHEMCQQLFSLFQSEIESPTINDDDKKDDASPKASLFRMESRNEWKEEDVKEQRYEMQKQLLYLAKSLSTQ